MQQSTIRKKLYNYIDNGDEKLLKLMYAVAKEYNEDDDYDYDFSEDDIKLFEQRRIARQEGKSKIYKWEKAKEILTAKKI